MTDQTTPAGEAPQERPTAEELRVRAEHKQAIAKIEYEHELEQRRLDHDAMRRMPFALRALFDQRLQDLIERNANRMAESGAFCPKHLQGNPAACAVVVTRAIGWNLDPYSVAMATYVTPDGKIAFEGKLYRAIAEASGELAGPIRFEYYGDWNQLPRPRFKMVTKHRQNGSEYQVPEPAWQYYSEVENGLGVKIIGKLRTGEEISIDFDLIEAHPRNATTWPTRPKTQILQPAIRSFVNNVRPSLLMGVPFREDLDEAELPEPEMREVNPRSQEAAAAEERERWVYPVYPAPEPVDLREAIKAEQEGPEEHVDPETGEVTEGPAAPEPQKRGDRPTMWVLDKSYVNPGSAQKELTAILNSAAADDLYQHENNLRRTLVIMKAAGRDVDALEAKLNQRLAPADRQSVPDEPELDEDQDEHLQTIAQEEPAQQPLTPRGYEEWREAVRAQASGAPSLGHVKSYRSGRLAEAAAYGEFAVADVNEIFDQAEVRLTAAQRRATQMG